MPSGKRGQSDHNDDITWQIQQFRILNLALTPYWNLMVLSTILQSVLQQGQIDFPSKDGPTKAQPL